MILEKCSKEKRDEEIKKFQKYQEYLEEIKKEEEKIKIKKDSLEAFLIKEYEHSLMKEFYGLFRHESKKEHILHQLNQTFDLNLKEKDIKDIVFICYRTGHISQIEIKFNLKNDIFFIRIPHKIETIKEFEITNFLDIQVCKENNEKYFLSTKNLEEIRNYFNKVKYGLRKEDTLL